MRDKEDEIPFIILRTIECSEASVLMARNNCSHAWAEDVYMKSQKLKTSLQQIATCYFQPTKDTMDERFGFNTKNLVYLETLSQNLIAPADSFLYHHRQALANYATENIHSQRHTRALIDYIKLRFESKFAETDNLFAKGLVTQESIKYLFKPNELVISGTYGQPAAFVLQEWPKLNSDGWVTLKCWSFHTDGKGFARRASTLSVAPIGPSSRHIEDLIAYPLRFAKPVLLESIRSRGQRHWQYRTAAQVTYKGWNVRKDQYFVS